MFKPPRESPRKVVDEIKGMKDAQFTECGELVEQVNHRVRPMQEVESEVLEAGTVKREDVDENVDALFRAKADMSEGTARIAQEPAEFGCVKNFRSKYLDM